MTSASGGILRDDKDEHSSKAFFAIWLSFDPDSNVTVDKLLHPKKQRSRMTSTLDGILMDNKDEHF
jgi:hypothetical protein